MIDPGLTSDGWLFFIAIALVIYLAIQYVPWIEYIEKRWFVDDKRIKPRRTASLVCGCGRKAMYRTPTGNSCNAHKRCEE